MKLERTNGCEALVVGSIAKREEDELGYQRWGGAGANGGKRHTTWSGARNDSMIKSMEKTDGGQVLKRKVKNEVALCNWEKFTGFWDYTNRIWKT